MRSLQWRMLAGLGLVVALVWSISIAMLISYLNAGPSTAWRGNLGALSDTLVKALPREWVRVHEPSEAQGVRGIAPQSTRISEEKALAAHPQRVVQPNNDVGGMLTAMLLNTIELAVVGVVMWWIVVASLRPLRALSEDIARRKAFDSEPLLIDQVPDELRPLILAFNSLLRRVDTAMRAERQFIADAAHELRTPLAALHMQGEVGLRADTVERKNEALKKLLVVSHRTHRLAEQLLDLARLDAGLHATGLHYTDLLDLSRHVISEFSIQAGARGTRLLLSGASCLVKCDLDEIGILLRNLIDNAIRHGRDFGTVEIRCGYIIRENGRHPLLEVRDNGPGVPEEERTAIFNRFYRAKDVEVRGSGIGLSLVASIARLHDAVIETGQGKNGQGFLIRFIFPAETLGS
ncbi:ATP-binding protein [Dyella caseinilytica]|uniref:histidine kinase n=1 Tax=Dyella caseinilytica TaxID=1849581 RepID=A0ABX7H0C0_9GAMM|nr:ATP-binding protein [Dyella caseinilytica]QRN55638.1 two-component sensor histidine kinase [Dyella caseinilytica]GGA03329.1 two-component sensor histidine kinase [Dyella caseinilytica]